MNSKRLSLCLLLCLALLGGLCASASAESVKLYGRDYPLDAESVDLRSMGHGEGEANAAMLALLPELKTVELGEEQEGGPDWEDILALRQRLRRNFTMLLRSTVRTSLSRTRRWTSTTSTSTTGANWSGAWCAACPA